MIRRNLQNSFPRLVTRCGAGGLPGLAAIAGGGLLELPLEGAAKGGFGFVAYVGSDVASTARGGGQGAGGQLQAPARQISHWRHGEKFAETLHQRRARQANFLGQFGDVPWMVHRFVWIGQPFSAEGTARPGEPASLSGP